MTNELFLDQLTKLQADINSHLTHGKVSDSAMDEHFESLYDCLFIYEKMDDKHPDKADAHAILAEIRGVIDASEERDIIISIFPRFDKLPYKKTRL